jgi:raffinose/stachyose/melibiose transport system substrate-binding protein
MNVSRDARGFRYLALRAVIGLAVVGAACTPGGTKKTTTTKPADTGITKEPVTLTIWDQEVRGGQNDEITQLNKEFQEKYPNVTIKRVAKSFTDLLNTVKLAVAGPNAPDIVEANQGRPIMGELVRAGLLLPLNDYADAYGWNDRYSSALLQLNSFSADGREFGSGNLYGLSQVGEIVGVYYNKEKLTALGLDVPATFDEFVAALDAAKAAGEVPIQFGNLDKWPGIHEFQAIQNDVADKQALRDFVFARTGAAFDTTQNTEAATMAQEWVDKGYFTPGFNGLGYDDAWPQFTDGKGVFLITGTWLSPDLEKAMGQNVGFFLVPPAEASAPPVALGGEGLPFVITAKSKNPDVAAAYLDFITNQHAAEVIVGTGGLPTFSLPNPDVPAGTSLADIFAAWKTLNDSDGIVPYLDYATPTFYDTITAAIQELFAKKATPDQFTEKVETDYSEFVSTL